MAIVSKVKLEQYHYGIDVRRGRQLYGMSGKKLYFGQWISRSADPIIIVEMNEEIAQREAFFYRELNGHDHIIRTLGYVENNLNLTIFTQEYAQQGDLSNLLMDNIINITQTMLIEIFSQVADGMSYVASKSIVHGDLGCRNILVYKIDPSQPKRTLVKITDFGLARSSDCPPSLDEETTPIIPFRYCAPEILRDDYRLNYSEKSDVYSMGVLMWEALSNAEMPYSSIADDLIVKQMKLNKDTLMTPSNCDRKLWILMGNCWIFDPLERINFEQIKDRLSEIHISDLEEIQILISSFEPPTPYEYKLDRDIRMQESLNGSYGKTYEAQWILHKGSPIVLIKMDKQPTKQEILFYTEFKSHPHIVHSFGFVENDLQSILLLQERAPHGNLQNLLDQNQFQPSVKVLVQIFLQIVNAMIFITKQNLVHGDLRCANVLIFQMDSTKPEENLIKLTNFTSAHKNDPSLADDRRSVIPVRYCALEILRSAGRSNYSELSDVYSMGVLMWEACSNGQVPYNSSLTNSEVRQRKLNKEKLSKPLLCNNMIWSIMEDCWHNEPEVRYDFEGIEIRLSNVDPESENTNQYAIDVDVRKGNQLYGKFGRIFYEAEWIQKEERSIILLMMDEKVARHEVPFYIQLNSHAHIIQTFGMIRDNSRSMTLVQERALHGNLQILLQNKQFQPTDNVLVNIFLQIIDAMIYIAKQNIVHGDLRCENILVFKMNSTNAEENLVKLTNFNLARHSDPSFIDNRQTVVLVRYCAPEILQNSHQSNYSELSDVYSMGVLMWEACSEGNLPYGSNLSDEDIRQYRLKNEILLQPNGCDNQIWTVIQYCWHKEPGLRFNFAEMQILLLSLIPPISCPHCHAQFKAKDMPNHLKSHQPRSIPLVDPPKPTLPVQEPPPEPAAQEPPPEPPAREPPAREPPAREPPAREPPAREPPAREPSVRKPPPEPPVREPPPETPSRKSLSERFRTLLRFGKKK